jgi:phenylacetate-coenzyme A ligase PaaK-like adenylate-forming protein
VRLFKTLNLQSVGPDEVFKVLTSSGTTSQVPSRIVLDRETAQLQTKVLVSIMTSFLGKQRLPMVVCDSQSVLKNRSAYTARGAGIMGMATFGRDHFYALDESMSLRIDDLLRYVEAHRGQQLLFFGFTFMVWQHVVEPLQARGIRLEPSGGVLVHSGGWKKLAERAVTNERFKSDARQCLGVENVHNFYGMVEQVGSVYVECEHGYLHAPNFAEILVRDYRRWNVLPPGEQGVIQTLSLLPRSYPGHSLLTEDLGIVHGQDDCPCGRKGTYFSILGRIPQAELRGCSDTYAESAAPTPARTSK